MMSHRVPQAAGRRQAEPRLILSSEANGQTIFGAAVLFDKYYLRYVLSITYRMPGHKRQIKVRKRRLNLSKYRIYDKVPMSFFVVVKGCVNFYEMTSVHKKRVFAR
jgi:hypothetical protein